MQNCNLPGAVLLVLEKLGEQPIKGRRINVCALLPGNCPFGRTMTGHSPWRAWFNLRRVNVRIVLGKVTMECEFFRVFLPLLIQFLS